MNAATLTKPTGNPTPKVASARISPSEGAAAGYEEYGYFVVVTDTSGKSGTLIDRAMNVSCQEAERVARGCIGANVDIYSD